MGTTPEGIAFRDCMIDLVDDCRTMVDEEFCLRLYAVSTVLRVWAGGELGRGSYVDTETVFDPRPRVREPSPYLLRSEAGTYETGDRIVDKLSGSFTLAQLTGGKLAVGSEFFWRIDGEKYAVSGEPEKKYVDYRVKLKRMNRTRVA